ncbi:Sodium-dependent dicarboxylate transporter SdcS [Zhongshania aliphaticivorans]|uniref:Sodium-dependent dicarboxylate transporter SdcS n=1 Tax=Zhongshania aliphaticivorans TaxID=1470434 RepID=A0A5S9PIL3_9GAMM|nr:DASS family sodium-coupled anion symporter [Zhongshania aliphaticivorans]CAA0103964.1 Sodium-dependent dicarboxylate transporter SdcS [Zhongshania aliphaticivorans]
MSELPTNKTSLYALAIGPAILVITMLMPAPLGMADEAWLALGGTLWMAIWWATEAVPIPVTALLPLILVPVLGIGEVEDLADAYANGIIFLFLGGFLLGLAMQRWELHRRIALNILLAVGQQPNRQIAGFMIATAFLSMWVSNTATSIMMLPIGLSVISFLPEDNSEERRQFAVALLLAIAYSASIGGIATLIGTPPNAMLVAYLKENHDINIGFGEWMLIGLPISIAMLVFTWWWLCRKGFSGLNTVASRDLLRAELDKLGVLSGAEARVLIIFLVTAIAWITRPLINNYAPGVSDTVIAMAAGLLLFTVRSGEQDSQALLNWQTAEKLPWGVLLLFGGGLALATMIKTSGLAEWLAQNFSLLAAWPMFAVVLVIVAVIIFLTEITSNTATTATFLPLLGALAVANSVSPMLFVIPAAVAASCAFMMPVATPPNAVVFGSGELKIKDMMGMGFTINLFGIAVVSVAGYYLVSQWFIT